MVGFGGVGMAVEGRHGNHRDAVLHRQVAREVGFVLLRYLAVVGQQEERAGAGQGAKTRVGQALRQAVALGLIERRQVQVRLGIAHEFGQCELHGRGHREHHELMHLAQLGA
ncbi:hypothetical protein D3C87_1601900 [compost metagenome]